MRHLANAQYWDRPAGGNTGRLFLAFGGPVCADRFSNCPLDRVLTYKNLIYLLNLQFQICCRLSLAEMKGKIMENLSVLEREELVTRRNSYQDLINSIVQVSNFSVSSSEYTMCILYSLMLTILLVPACSSKRQVKV